MRTNEKSTSKINKVLLALVSLAIAFGIGFYATPNKVVVETREVVKTVTVTKEAKTLVIYKERIRLPDGTIIDRETYREEIVVDTGTSTESDKTNSKKSTKDIGLTLSMLAIVDSNDFKGHRDYGLHVNKRIFSNIVVGVLATTDKKLGISIGLSF